jgi:hypothetical protein
LARAHMVCRGAGPESGPLPAVGRRIRQGGCPVREEVEHPNSISEPAEGGVEVSNKLAHGTPGWCSGAEIVDVHRQRHHGSHRRHGIPLSRHKANDNLRRLSEAKSPSGSSCC